MQSKQPVKIKGSIEKDELEEALQQAINLEIATIPTYLFTYYSLKRTWSQVPANQSKDNQANRDRLAKYQNKLNADEALICDKGAPINLQTAEGLRKYIDKVGKYVSPKKSAEMALDIQVFANQAAATIMSVVIEEMLHMALTSNVKQALFKAPDLVEGLPYFPVAGLPGHIPTLPIDLTKFTQDQLKTFLKIESPEKYDDTKLMDKKVVDYHTIGEFYRMIEECVKKYYAEDSCYSKDRPQLAPRKGYYGPNSINTVYYDRKHNPHFMSEDDSGGLVHVQDMKSALHAMEIVVEQGEGSSGGDHLTPEGEPICPKGVDWDDPKTINPKDFDDSEGEELSHFAKFLMLYCQGEHLIKKFAEHELDFHSFFVYDFHPNPHVETYRANEEIQASSRLLNAIYTYTFLMVESCYHHAGNTQFEVFMFGVHKSMIWCISELANTMRSWQAEIDGKPYQVGPTFERYEFSKGIPPKQQLIELAHQAPDGSGPSGWDISWILDQLVNFPDVSLDHKVSTLLTNG